MLNPLQQHFYDKMIDKINKVNGLDLRQELINTLDQLVESLLPIEEEK